MPPAQTPGGLSQPVFITKKKPLSILNPTLDKILQNLKGAIVDRYTQAKCPNADKDALDFWPVVFRTQVVAGTNYYVKFKVIHGGMAPVPGVLEYIHVVIFDQPWTKMTQLTDLQTDKKLTDKLG